MTPEEEKHKKKKSTKELILGDNHYQNDFFDKSKYNTKSNVIGSDKSLDNAGDGRDLNTKTTDLKKQCGCGVNGEIGTGFNTKSTSLESSYIPDNFIDKSSYNSNSIILKETCQNSVPKVKIKNPTKLNLEQSNEDEKVLSINIKYLSDKEREELYKEILFYLIDLRENGIDLDSFLRYAYDLNDKLDSTISELFDRMNINKNFAKTNQTEIILLTFIYATIYYPDFDYFIKNYVENYGGNITFIETEVKQTIDGFYEVVGIDLDDFSLEKLQNLEISYNLDDIIIEEEEIDDDTIEVEEEEEDFEEEEKTEEFKEEETEIEPKPQTLVNEMGTEEKDEKLSKFDKINDLEPLIIKRMKLEEDRYINGEKPTPIYKIAEEFNVAQSVIQRIAKSCLNNDEHPNLYHEMYQKGGRRDFIRMKRINQYIESISNFFKEEYKENSWDSEDNERFNSLVNKLKTKINFEDGFHDSDHEILKNFFKSIPFIEKEEYSNEIVLFKQLYRKFYTVNPSQLYLDFIDSYFDGRENRKSFFKERQKNAGYRRKHYDDPDFRKSVITKEPFTRTKPYFTLICTFLRDRYKNNRWKLNSTEIQDIINDLFVFLKTQTNDFKTQKDFHRTDKEVLYHFINAIPILEEKEYYKFDTLNKIYRKIYSTEKECSNKFREKIDIYLGGKDRREKLLFNRTLKVASEQSDYLYFLLPKFIWSKSRTLNVENIKLQKSLLDLFGSAIFLPYGKDDPNIVRCSDFKITGSHDVNIKREDFSDFVEFMFKENLIIKNTSLGIHFMELTKKARKSFTKFDILFSKDDLIHAPLLKYIYHYDSLSIAIEVPLIIDDPRIKGHIDILVYYKSILYIVDFKPDQKSIDKFKSIPQIIAYAYLIRKILKVNNLEIRCITYNKFESWEFDPFVLFPYINNFIDSFGDEHPISKKKWLNYFKELN